MAGLEQFGAGRNSSFTFITALLGCRKCCVFIPTLPTVQTDFVLKNFVGCFSVMVFFPVIAVILPVCRLVYEEAVEHG